MWEDQHSWSLPSSRPTLPLPVAARGPAEDDLVWAGRGKGAALIYIYFITRPAAVVQAVAGAALRGPWMGEDEPAVDESGTRGASELGRHKEAARVSSQTRPSSALVLGRLHVDDAKSAGMAAGIVRDEKGTAG